MDNFKKIIEVINDLIKINKDREEVYVKASRELTPAEHNLRGVFERKAQESRNNVMQLQSKVEEVSAQAGEPLAAENSFLGALYSMWMDLKEAFSGNDDKAILQVVESGEKAAQKCYADALNEKELPADISNIIREQKQSIDESEKEIKNLLER
jgi:uncharacterized protein (TIGR02284 family)